MKVKSTFTVETNPSPANGLRVFSLFYVSHWPAA